MPAPIEISYHRFDPPDDVREKIEALVPDLDRYEDHITGGRIVVDGSHNQGSKTVLDIAVELDVKGKRIVSRRQAEYPSPVGQRTFSRAATEAFRVAQGELKEHVAQLKASQEPGRMAHEMGRGRIQSLDRTVENGFIEMADGTSLFFAAAVVEGPFDALAEGDMVRVRVADDESPYGPQAAAVQPEGPTQHDR